MEDEGLYYNKCWITILGAFVSVGASVDSFFVSFVSSVSVCYLHKVYEVDSMVILVVVCLSLVWPDYLEYAYIIVN